MDIKLLPARIDDLKQTTRKSNAPKFIGFLSPEETAIAVKQFDQCEEFVLFGGYDSADRVMLGIRPEWCDNITFPITAVTFTYRTCDNLSHRNFLGALMSLGIKREAVGDILIESGRAVVFVASDVSRFVLTQLEKVGSVGVVLAEGYREPLPEAAKKQSFSVTVSSTRLDCVVAAVCNLSRNQATQKISDGFVSVNSIATTKITANIKGGDKLSVRQKGKIEIVSCDEISKKGRIILKYNKYI